jgi:hypothetical protein
MIGNPLALVHALLSIAFRAPMLIAVGVCYAAVFTIVFQLRIFVVGGRATTLISSNLDFLVIKLTTDTCGGLGDTKAFRCTSGAA